jgi:hypothetical protein
MSVNGPRTQAETLGQELFNDVKHNVQGVLPARETKNKRKWIPLRQISLRHFSSNSEIARKKAIHYYRAVRQKILPRIHARGVVHNGIGSKSIYVSRQGHQVGIGNWVRHIPYHNHSQARRDYRNARKAFRRLFLPSPPQPKPQARPSRQSTIVKGGVIPPLEQDGQTWKDPNYFTRNRFLWTSRITPEDYKEVFQNMMATLQQLLLLHVHRLPNAMHVPCDFSHEDEVMNYLMLCWEQICYASAIAKTYLTTRYDGPEREATSVPQALRFRLRAALDMTVPRGDLENLSGYLDAEYFFPAINMIIDPVMKQIKTVLLQAKGSSQLWEWVNYSFLYTLKNGRTEDIINSVIGAGHGANGTTYDPPFRWRNQYLHLNNDDGNLSSLSSSSSIRLSVEDIVDHPRFYSRFSFFDSISSASTTLTSQALNMMQQLQHVQHYVPAMRPICASLDVLTEIYRRRQRVSAEIRHNHVLILMMQKLHPLYQRHMADSPSRLALTTTDGPAQPGFSQRIPSFFLFPEEEEEEEEEEQQQQQIHDAEEVEEVRTCPTDTSSDREYFPHEEEEDSDTISTTTSSDSISIDSDSDEYAATLQERPDGMPQELTLLEEYRQENPDISLREYIHLPEEYIDPIGLDICIQPVRIRERQPEGEWTLNTTQVFDYVTLYRWWGWQLRNYRDPTNPLNRLPAQVAYFDRDAYCAILEKVLELDNLPPSHRRDVVIPSDRRDTICGYL